MFVLFFFWGGDINDLYELKFFGYVWVIGERKKNFLEKKVYFSGIVVQNRSGKMDIFLHPQ